MELTQIRKKDGLQHGLINTVGNSVTDDAMSKFKEKDRPLMEKKKKDGERIVKAQYLNSRGGEERLERPYMEWAGQPITMWRFIHGETYDVPKGLVDDVNNPAKRPKKRSGLVDAKGNVLDTDQFEELEHRFVPIGF
jgi:hypothetical protein